MTEAQRQAILACFRLSTWDWVRLADLLRALGTDDAALDAIGGCIARGGSITTPSSTLCGRTIRAEMQPACR